MRTSPPLPEFVGFLALMWNMYWYLDATCSRPISALSCSRELGMAREDVQRRRSHLGKYTLVQAIILCQHFRGRVREPLREQHRAILGEVSLREDEKTSCSESREIREPESPELPFDLENSQPEPIHLDARPRVWFRREEGL
jgi:hypothetical protein